MALASAISFLSGSASALARRVGTMPCCERTNSGSPSPVRKRASMPLTVDCVSPRRCAARVTLRSSSSASRATRRLRSRFLIFKYPITDYQNHDFHNITARTRFRVQQGRACRRREKTTRSKEIKMTPEQIRLVQETFKSIKPSAAQTAALFYDRLFEVAPDVRPLFPVDLTEQKRKLMVMIGVAVDNLHHVERIVPAVQDLGRRHAAYGVRASHHQSVRHAP